MIKKLFKFSIIIGISVLLTGCGKSLTTEEVFSSSVNNFNNLSNYNSDLYLDASVDKGESSFVSINLNISQETDNINKVSVANNKINFSLLGFGDENASVSYIDYNDNKMYSNDGDEYYYKDISPVLNTSYIVSSFLQNGVSIAGEMSEYENNGINYYAIPCSFNFSTLRTFYSGLNINSEQVSTLNTFLASLSEQDLEKLNSYSIFVNYFVYKDSLLPARIIVDKESLKSFLTDFYSIYHGNEFDLTQTESQEYPGLTINASIEFSDDIDTDSILDDISFNINNMSIAFSNFNEEKTLSIPEDLKLNSKKIEDDSIVENTDKILEEDNPSFEVVEETNIDDTTDIDSNDTNFLVEDNSFDIFDDFGFNLNDSQVRFPLSFTDFNNLGFTIDESIDISELLSPGNYSVPIKYYSSDKDYFCVIYMNNTENELPLSDCTAFSIEIDSLFLENSTITTPFEVSFNSSVQDVTDLLGTPSYKYAGENTYVYTYEKDRSHYLELQIDKESDKVVYIKFISADI